MTMKGTIVYSLKHLMFQLLRKDPLLSQERKLFTYFFTNPAKLHQVIEELSSRVEAEKHVDGDIKRLGHSQQK